ncbi:TPA: hypothetical protein ACT96X_002902 [Legionella pneumophila]|uniref:hypothetical protein n=1 Tax=Legionella pneumophila TaxID=446 RepID=UPI000AE06882|nr:hypothetical protein [Legionella pneumophila]HBD7103428.1 hypothetical protein [Legionella pneumophila]HCO4740027.1 hypothetical protein [Legionella pneumophila]HDU7930899.1 hypothetical protein [Legionella pneumophila]HEG4433847.1 hypothetical protein [Legionella pneumophila]HEN5655337.1 hypothetical protein [Legionella pneumophila]
MVQFAKPSNGPQNDCGRINLLIGSELGQYQNIIRKWIAKLEDNGKNKPSDISQFKFGKILGYLLLQCIKKANLSPEDFESFAKDPWEEPTSKYDREKKAIIQQSYRVYFYIPVIDRSDKEKINANKEKAQIHHFTTRTNDGLMVFSFEDKVEEIEPKLFVELAKNIKVESDAWAQLFGFIEKNFQYSQDVEFNPQVPQILGLILYATIFPEHRNEAFNDLCPLLLKSKPNFNSITTKLLKDIIPDYETKVMAFLHKNNNPMRYKENDISEQGALLGLSREKVEVVKNEMRERKSLEEQNNNRSQAIELRKTLIGAVDEYLRWRNNESKETDYKKSSGAFTWLRHYTDFGKNRANDLKNDLNKAQDLKTMLDILQKHFANNSQLHNHSLDSYLLRAIYKDSKDSNKFNSIFNFKHLTIKNDTDANREWLREEMLGMVEKTNMNVTLENPTVSRQESPTLPNKAKVRISIMKIPANEREENILAVYTVLKNDELLRNQGGSVPTIIKEIRDIVGKIDPSEEENIATAIIEIKRKIANNSDNNYNENAHDIIKAFESPSCCDFRKIRAALTTNPAMDEIMNPVRVGVQLN